MLFLHLVPVGSRVEVMDQSTADAIEAQVERFPHRFNHEIPGENAHADDRHSRNESGNQCQSRAEGSHLLLGLADSVADSPNRLDQFGGKLLVHLLANALNVNINEVGVRVERVVPDMLADLHATDDPTR